MQTDSRSVRARNVSASVVHDPEGQPSDKLMAESLTDPQPRFKLSTILRLLRLRCPLLS